MSADILYENSWIVKFIYLLIFCHGCSPWILPHSIWSLLHYTSLCYSYPLKIFAFDKLIKFFLTAYLINIFFGCGCCCCRYMSRYHGAGLIWITKIVNFSMCIHLSLVEGGLVLEFIMEILNICFFQLLQNLFF